tara:strand:- start:824 stop:1540 length:717 start_codon:yes stop_codon:yes gene_type:complete
MRVIKKKVGHNIIANNANWTFQGIEKNFQKHISTSVPMYSESHKISLNIADFFLKNNSNVLDIGCSTGFFLDELYKKNIKKKINCYGVDNTKSMISFCKKKRSKKIKFYYNDYLKLKNKYKFDLITAFYTLSFIPTSQRQIFLNKVYKNLNWGGAFILFEKIRAPDARFQDLYSLIYQDFKLSKGLSEQEIVNKSRSLKGIMEPFSDKGNLNLLKGAGFKDVAGIFQWICFKGYLLIK